MIAIRQLGRRWTLATLWLLGCASQHSLPGDSTDQVGDRPSAMQAPLDAGASFLGASAHVDLEPLAGVSDASALKGSGSLVQRDGGTDLTIDVLGCDKSMSYAVYIEAGSDCSATTLSGRHWDGARGEGIAAIDCIGATGMGRVFYSRSARDAKPWTVGSPAASDVDGHALAIFDPAGTPIACGIIARDDVQVPIAGEDAGSSALSRAILGGLCLGQMLVRDNRASCPDPDALASCTSDHCALGDCIDACKDYLACMEANPADPCAAQPSCPITTACTSCQTQITGCSFDFCSDELACASPPTPGGPCSQLEACCEMQGSDAASCLQIVHQIEQLSGDPSCLGAENDEGITGHLKVPCRFK